MEINLGYITKIASVTVVLTEKGYTFNLVVVKNKKNRFDIVKNESDIPDVPTLLKHAGKYTSFILHFAGKGILNKKVENVSNYRNNILFDSNQEEFYFTDVQTSSHIFSSMIRKNVVEEIMQEFNTKLNHIISISTGPFLISSIKDYISSSKILADGFVLFFEKDTLIDFKKDELAEKRSYSFDKKILRENEISALAHAVAFFQKENNIIYPEEETIFIDAKKEAEQKNIFMRFGAGMLFFFLFILMGNLVYLDQLNDTIENNYEELMLSEQTLQQLGIYKEEKNRKEKMLNSSGLLNKKFLSYYLMELANSVPQDISFSSISIRPLMKEIKKNFKIEIEENLIFVSGESTSSNVLSEWIKELKRKEWVGKIDIISYIYTKGRGEFELKIELTNV